MSDQTQSADARPVSPFEYWQESLSAWKDFSQRAGAIWMQQASRAGVKTNQGDAETETLTADFLRTFSDFNLRRWQNAARVLEAMPDWMSAPSLVNGGAITDWFDQFRRDHAPTQTTPHEHIAARTEPALSAPVSLSAPDGKADDLTQIKGIGPKLRERLNQLGIYHFTQIAKWSAPETAWVEDALSFKGRATREKWVMQARKFSANGAATLH
ncbi:MAG: hypothetical protein L3J02_08885 [Henriciella sp.]|nr:hypothetical protein [Henriciella sp.]